MRRLRSEAERGILTCGHLRVKFCRESEILSHWRHQASQVKFIVYCMNSAQVTAD